MVISLEITEVAWPGVGHRGTALVEEVSEHSTAGNTLADPLLQGALQFVANSHSRRSSVTGSAQYYGSGVTVES